MAFSEPQKVPARPTSWDSRLERSLWCSRRPARAREGIREGARDIPETQCSTRLLSRWCVDQAQHPPGTCRNPSSRPLPCPPESDPGGWGSATSVSAGDSDPHPRGTRLQMEVDTITGLKAQELVREPQKWPCGGAAFLSARGLPTQTMAAKAQAGGQPGTPPGDAGASPLRSLPPLPGAFSSTSPRATRQGGNSGVLSTVVLGPRGGEKKLMAHLLCRPRLRPQRHRHVVGLRVPCPPDSRAASGHSGATRTSAGNQDTPRG